MNVVILNEVINLSLVQDLDHELSMLTQVNLS